MVEVLVGNYRLLICRVEIGNRYFQEMLVVPFRELALEMSAPALVPHSCRLGDDKRVMNHVAKLAHEHRFLIRPVASVSHADIVPAGEDLLHLAIAIIEILVFFIYIILSPYNGSFVPIMIEFL